MKTEVVYSSHETESPLEVDRPGPLPIPLVLLSVTHSPAGPRRVSELLKDVANSGSGSGREVHEAAGVARDGVRSSRSGGTEGPVPGRAGDGNAGSCRADDRVDVRGTPSEGLAAGVTCVVPEDGQPCQRKRKSGTRPGTRRVTYWGYQCMLSDGSLEEALCVPMAARTYF